MSAIRPRNADDLTPAESATAAIDMDLVLEREPQLGDFGFGVYAKTPEERAADLLRNRDLIREPRSLAQVMAASPAFGWRNTFSNRFCRRKEIRREIPPNQSRRTRCDVDDQKGERS